MYDLVVNLNNLKSDEEKKMVTISKTVEKLVEENAFIEEALCRGIINYAALAEELKPSVSRVMNTSVETSAIMMALRRLKERLVKREFSRPKFDVHTDILITSDLFEITLKKTTRACALLKEVYHCIDSERDFIAVTQGRTEVTLIANKRNKKHIMHCIGREKVVKEIHGLASLSITLPPEAINESGYFYIVTRAFAWEDIPIVELVSTLTELHCIVHERNVPRAFTVLKEVVGKNQKISS